MQEDGWVVCRVFKKNSFHKTFSATAAREAIGEENPPGLPPIPPQPYRQSFLLPLDLIPFENAMHLPQLLSSEPPNAAASSAFLPAPTMNTIDHDRARDIMKLRGSGGGYLPTEKAAGDWSILEKLLAGHQSQLEQLFQAKCCPPAQILELGSSAQPQTRFSLPYLCAEADLLKYSKQA
ncbi:hypothetical protein HPP92_002487 [Vanilla planifolia]|uniref:Uncharacterized protein n=1 Tax=Vanilla planifolia TaxID=51239 RepID=A0A835S1A5_VANPL|nr:hypothetical protein HPP92_002487 [Vanilla planifolia]